jgi:hypothetical protein
MGRDEEEGKKKNKKKERRRRRSKQLLDYFKENGRSWKSKKEH